MDGGPDGETLQETGIVRVFLKRTQRTQKIKPRINRSDL